jgi:hypothetical protein
MIDTKKFREKVSSPYWDGRIHESAILTLLDCIEEMKEALKCDCDAKSRGFTILSCSNCKTLDSVKEKLK